MIRARSDGLYLLLLGSITFLLFGALMLMIHRGQMLDFELADCSAQCLLQHCDPYRQSDVLRIYRAKGETLPTDSDRTLIVATRNVYPPSEFVFTVPFALLPPRLAQVLWVGIIAGSFLLASFLMWNLGASYAPVMSGGLIYLSFVFSGSLMSYGNPGGIAVGLCIIAVWCFLQERFVPAGILCLAVSLMLKPHDAALVWLYFFLAGGRFRRLALQTLAVVAVLSLPAVLWVTHLSPHWMQEMHSNLLAFSGHGGIDDPGPSAPGGHGTCMITSLQSAISSFWDDPRIYNPVTYILCAPLLLVWGFVTLRSRATQTNAWYALAAISAISMLPIYHRQYDAKLVLLTVPAFALLWAAGGPIKWVAFAVNTVGFILIGDLPWAFLVTLLTRSHQYTSEMSIRKLTAILDVPLPLVLLVMGTFYLWVYARRAADPALPAKPGDMADTPIRAVTAS
jgi:hypothetical protein